jgi:hypothetical protein
MSYAETVSARHPDLAQRVQGLLEHYAKLRYGTPDGAGLDAEIEEFRRAVARLSLPRVARGGLPPVTQT